MQTKSFQKFCPACKLSNDANALVCRHCGGPLLSDAPEVPSPAPPAIHGKPAAGYEAPPEGLAFFIPNKPGAIAVRTDEEFILGRVADETSEPILDLTDQDGFAFGVSRRHAMIRATGDRYVLIDLNSSNGTWIDGQLLVPTKPHHLPSGAVIQLGRLKLVVSYTRPRSS
jgi:hypothetical protein